MISAPVSAPKVKVCGFTRTDDVRAGIAAGVDAFGFNLAKGPRKITPEQAGELQALLPPFSLSVALFVDADAATVRAQMRVSGCQVAQLHGNESAEMVQELRQDFPVIKAFRIRDQAMLDQIAGFPRMHYYWMPMCRALKAVPARRGIIVYCRAAIWARRLFSPVV